MGAVVNFKRIERPMRLACLRGISRRRSRYVTTRRDKSARGEPGLANRQFTATAIHQLWVVYMTYLAVVVDAYSRKGLGWAFSEQMAHDLVIAALNMAITTRRRPNQ